jgi:hypothetical protein
MAEISDFIAEAVDVASDVIDSGQEFLADSFTELQEQVGDFAGDSNWFDTNNFGSILDNVPSVSDFSLPSLPSSFPSLSSITSSIPSVSSITAGLPSLPTSIPSLSSITRSIPGVNSITSALPTSLLSGTAISSAALKTATGLVNSQTSGLPSLPSLTSIAGRVLNTIVPSASAATIPNVGRIITSSVTVSAAPSNFNNATPIVTPLSEIDESAANVGYITGQDPENGTYYVQNEATGAIVASGFTQQQAILRAQDQTFIDAGDVPPTTTGDATAVNYTAPTGVSGQGLTVAYDEDGNLLPGYTLNENNDPVFVGGGFVEPATQALADAARTAALRDQARQQQTIRAQRQNLAQASDWRVRLRLAPQSNYLYNASDCGPVLWPLRLTDGVIFPYTPQIDMAYKANYDAYDLTHSNYRGYFYKNSAIDSVNLKATFTAQDTKEANYLLAVIHFFRSATKMFYGQDAERGSPPPLTYLSGLGDFQFNEHPCLISQFNYSLPSDVNYIRAQSVLQGADTNLLNARQRQTVLGNPLSYALQRLSTVGMSKGGLDAPFAVQGSLGANNPTYVPTKMENNLVLLPIQSRSQVSKQFSVKSFANGNLLKGGFW